MIFIENKGTLHTSVFQKKKQQTERVPESALEFFDDWPSSESYIRTIWMTLRVCSPPVPVYRILPWLIFPNAA